MHAFPRVLRLIAALLPVAYAVAAQPAWAGAQSARSSTQSSGLMLPVTPACVSSPFGPRILPGRPLAGTFHYGIDLPAPEGAPVYATAPGEVIRVQRHGPGGLEMLIQHPGFIAVYSHLGHVAPVIADGQRTVFGGEVIGVVGHTGVTYGMHLYFGIFVSGRPVDPTPYLEVSACGGSSRPRPQMLATDGRRPPSRTYMQDRLAEGSRLASK